MYNKNRFISKSNPSALFNNNKRMNKNSPITGFPLGPHRPQ